MLTRSSTELMQKYQTQGPQDQVFKTNASLQTGLPNVWMCLQHRTATPNPADAGFYALTLEQLVEALRQISDVSWISEFYTRYLDFTQIRNELI